METNVRKSGQIYSVTQNGDGMDGEMEDVLALARARLCANRQKTIENSHSHSSITGYRTTASFQITRIIPIPFFLFEFTIPLISYLT